MVMRRCLLAVLTMVSVVAGSVITSAAVLPRATPGALSNDPYDCDGKVFCPEPSGTCYTGMDGYIGCCSVGNCAVRTTCIPYTSGVSQGCDPNTGGCLVCSEPDIPECATITNVQENQYIMYCNVEAILVTTSYQNLITVGSMALPPNIVTQSIGPATEWIESSSRTSSSIPPTDPRTSTPTPTATGLPISQSDAPSASDTGLSKGILVAVIVCSILGSAAIAILVFFLYRKRRNSPSPYVQADDGGSSGKGNGVSEISNVQPYPPSPIPDAPDTPQPNYTSPGSPGFISRSFANDPNGYLSPIAAQRAARIAEAMDARAGRVFEMEGNAGSSATLPVNRSEGTATVGNRPSSWTPPAQLGGEEKLSSRWTANSAPVVYQPYSPDNVNGEGESPGMTPSQSRQSIRPVPYSAEIGSRINQIAVDANGVSPAMTSTSFGTNAFVSPMLVSGAFSTTPLMGLNNKPSVGELRPKATVDGPLNWPNMKVVRKKSGLMSATGAEANYVSPEAAMANGFTAGEEEQPAKDNKPGPARERDQVVS